MEIKIYTDGACIGNPGPGGWAAIIISENKKNINKDKLKYMRIFRKMVDKYGYNKYVKRPQYFCHLDWWHTKEAFMPVKSFKSKYGVKGHSINSMFGKRTKFKPYAIHMWRSIAINKYKMDMNREYDQNSLWEMLKDYVDFGK